MEESGQSVKLETTIGKRDLGIWMDSGLKFDGHVAMAVSRANAVLGMIKRSFVYMDIPMLRQLYMALVRPHLEYVWQCGLASKIQERYRYAGECATQSNKISTCFEEFEIRETFKYTVA